MHNSGICVRVVTTRIASWTGLDAFHNPLQTESRILTPEITTFPPFSTSEEFPIEINDRTKLRPLPMTESMYNASALRLMFGNPMPPDQVFPHVIRCRGVPFAHGQIHIRMPGPSSRA